MELIVNETIETKIYEIRGMKVMLDGDLAKLYQVETRALNQAVKRNIERFPYDFMLNLVIAKYETIHKANLGLLRASQ